MQHDACLWKGTKYCGNTLIGRINFGSGKSGEASPKRWHWILMMCSILIDGDREGYYWHSKTCPMALSVFGAWGLKH